MKRIPIGLVFPGQGTQKAGMGEIWRESPSWKLTETISEATGEDVSRLLLHTPAEQLLRTDLAQLSVFSVGVIAHAEAVRTGVLDGAVIACAGHSLGEYTALAAAGALTVEAAARLVAVRGRAMRDAARARAGTMGVLVAAPLNDVEELVRLLRSDGAEIWVANVNAPGQTVLSGSAEAIELAADQAPSIGAKAIRLQVGGAFHSPYMAPAAEALGHALNTTVFAPAHLPVVANVDGEPHAAGSEWPGLATRQLTSPVQWEKSVRTLTGRLGCRRLVELGPGRTLTGMIRRITPETEVASVDSPDAPGSM
ncbi:ACP S-malonyltransferase [Streptomyces sp. CG1]|uniref:ACP S-malonyltransferase n=1 Tax=Streptomyces sp. CG1 TaxID=1287523 RepID=UPI0034E247AE